MLFNFTTTDLFKEKKSKKQCILFRKEYSVFSQEIVFFSIKTFFIQSLKLLQVALRDKINRVESASLLPVIVVVRIFVLSPQIKEYFAFFSSFTYDLLVVFYFYVEVERCVYVTRKGRSDPSISPPAIKVR